jgi:hypothetical protein
MQSVIKFVGQDHNNVCTVLAYRKTRYAAATYVVVTVNGRKGVLHWGLRRVIHKLKIA